MFPGQGQQLSPADEERFNKFLTDQQIKDSQRTFNHISEKCFIECVSDFRSRNLTPKEGSCVANCAEKYMKGVTRCGIRFQEQNMATPPPGQF